MITTTPLTHLVDHLGTLSLAATIDEAALQTRVDRKYVIDARTATEVLAPLSTRLAALEIDDRRRFGYESRYLDTADLTLFRATALRRPHRIKVRTRTYLDSGLQMLEVKTRTRRGVTVKERIALAATDASTPTGSVFDDTVVLTDDACAFVDEHAVLPVGARHLVPVLTTRYHRSTLVDRGDGARVTIDDSLRCIGVDGRVLALADGDVVLETKSTGSPSTIDRALWRAGCRPTAISKFGVGLAGLHPVLPSARWRRTIRQHFALVT